MSDFIENCPQKIFQKIWESMKRDEKENFVFLYPDQTSNVNRVGNHYHCALCMLTLLYDTFCFDDGQPIPKAFSYKKGPGIQFAHNFELSTWQLRKFYLAEEVTIPTNILVYFFSQCERTFSTENEADMVQHVKNCHNLPHFLWRTMFRYKSTNFINCRRITRIPSTHDQSSFANFFVNKISQMAENRITWDPIYVDGQILPGYPALRCLAFFLREAKADDSDNFRGGRTSKSLPLSKIEQITSRKSL